MQLNGKVAIVTGGAGGIGRALAGAFRAEGARVVTADVAPGADVVCDVTDGAAVASLVAEVTAAHGRVDLFCSNAGMAQGEPDHAASAPDAVWQASWDLHVMAHVHAARAVLPQMIARGDGYLLNVASAAGLLCQIGDAAYSASKAAAVSFAQSLAITHADDGIGVSVVCPQYVATPLIGHGAGDAPAGPGILSPDDVARAVVAGLAEERFLILPHPEVARYFALRAADPDRWLKGMRKLRRKVLNETGQTSLGAMSRLV